MERIKLTMGIVIVFLVLFSYSALSAETAEYPEVLKCEGSYPDYTCPEGYEVHKSGVNCECLHHCGNGLCEEDKDENTQNCPEDCLSSDIQCDSIGCGKISTVIKNVMFKLLCNYSIGGFTGEGELKPYEYLSLLQVEPTNMTFSYICGEYPRYPRIRIKNVKTTTLYSKSNILHERKSFGSDAKNCFDNCMYDICRYSCYYEDCETEPCYCGRHECDPYYSSLFKKCDPFCVASAPAKCSKKCFESEILGKIIISGDGIKSFLEDCIDTCYDIDGCIALGCKKKYVMFREIPGFLPVTDQCATCGENKGSEACVCPDSCSLAGKIVDPGQSCGGNRFEAVTTYKYNVLGQIEEFRDAEGRVTKLSYDPSGKVKNVSDPDLGTIEYEYYRNDLRKSITNANGDKVVYYYDRANRIKKIDYPRSFDTTYFYDTYANGEECKNGKGRLCEVRDESGATRIEYDIRGRIKKKISAIRGRNLILNGGFERGKWLWNMPTQASIVTDSHSGGKAVSISVKEGEEYVYIYQLLPIEENEVYLLSLYAKSPTSSNLGVTLTFYDSNERRITPSDNAIDAFQSVWSVGCGGGCFYSGNIKTAEIYKPYLFFFRAPTGAKTVEIGIGIGNAGGNEELYIDEVQLVRKSFVINGGFEKEGWMWTTFGSVSYTSDAHSGDKALKITDASPYEYIMQTLPIYGNEIYAVSAYAKSPANSDLGIALKFYDKDGNLIQPASVSIDSLGYSWSDGCGGNCFYSGSTSTTARYERYYYVFKAPDNAVKMELYIGTGASGGELYLDDVQLYYVNMTEFENNIFDVEYFYDFGDNIIAIRYPSGRYIQFGINDKMQVNSVFIRFVPIAAFEYTPTNAFKKITMGNGVVTSYEYYPRGWIKSVESVNPSGNKVFNEYYEYYKNGNVKRISVGPGQDMNLVYDPYNRLVSVENNGYYLGIGDISYEYDKTGNRLRYVIGEQTQEYRYYNTDGSVSMPGSKGETSRLAEDARYIYEYDKAGNMIRRKDKSTGGVTYYFYDEAGKLKKVVLPNGKVARYLYNYEGRLVAMEFDNNATIYFHGSGMVEKFDYSLATYATQSPSIPIEIQPPYFGIENENGDTIFIIDNIGNMFIKGNVNEHQPIMPAADGNDFVIEDEMGRSVALVDSSGNVYLSGSLQTNINKAALAAAKARRGNFIIENREGEVVAYIDSNGNLYIAGKCKENYL
ncbi:MAG: hypothetical protein DRP03_01035 [Candidatus Aenigmatarchaeota archaeon]|nr:MAG: hypothetical protein DRP03_01035 [Candidatus Aenigmarchaeota archaeon]